MSDETREMTEGQRRVRINFNPNANPEVERVKQTFADVIDTCLDVYSKSDPRLGAHAATVVEDCCMVVVKAATA